MKRYLALALLLASVSTQAHAGFMPGIIHEATDQKTGVAFRHAQTFVGFEDKGGPAKALNQGEPPKSLDTSFVWGSRVREWLSGWYQGAGN